MLPPFRVVVPDYLTEAGVEEAVLSGLARLDLLRATDERQLAGRIEDADAILLFHDVRLTERTVARLDRCRVIVRCGVGYDNVDLAAAGRRGIVVCNVPDYGTEEVADHALMLLLAVARRLVVQHNAVAAGGWDPSLAFGTPRLRGRTIGLVGCGRIGTAMARRCLPLGLRVVFHDPYLPPGHEKALGVERVHRLEDLLPQCQFVSLHTPLTDETRHLLSARTLGLLPPGAFVINTARGACIDQEALLAGLESGRVAAAGLDVLETEPPVDDRLRRHSRVVLTPHTAYYSVEGAVEMRTKGAEEIRRALVGEPVRNPVNRRELVQPRCALVPVGP